MWGKKNLKIRNTVSCLVFFTVSSVTEGIFCTTQRDDFYTSSVFRPLWRHIPVAEAVDSGPALVWCRYWAWFVSAGCWTAWLTCKALVPPKKLGLNATGREMHSVCFHWLKADALQSWASQKIFICMPHCHWTLIWSVGSQRCDQLLSVTSRGVNWHLVLPSQERRVNRKAGSLNRIQAQNRLAPCWQSQWEGEAGGIYLVWSLWFSTLYCRSWVFRFLQPLYSTLGLMHAVWWGFLLCSKETTFFPTL